MLDTTTWFRPAEVICVQSCGDAARYILVAEEEIGRIIGAGWKVTNSKLASLGASEVQDFHDKCLAEAWVRAEKLYHTKQWIPEGSSWDIFYEPLWGVYEEPR